jgi:uncharacterized membrane protein YgdD (TMEM256/DUF423 family)
MGADPGHHHLVRIQRFQWILLALGAALWLFRSPVAAGIFTGGGLASILFWHFHRWVVTRMLTPSVARRWIFGSLVVLKLALIVLILRGMMICFPSEAIPFTTGILLFSGSLVLEGVWLIFRPDAPDTAKSKSEV